MKLRILAALAAMSLSALAAAPALADGRLAVTLEKPVPAKTKVVAGGAVFICEDVACVAASAPSRALSVASCKAVAKSAGRVAAFEAGAKSLASEELERCNLAAKAA